MRAALEHAGLVPRKQAVDAKYGERSAINFIDPRDLTDGQIVEELSAQRIDAADITRQLDDDKDAGLARGERWRGAAKRARRAKLLRVDQLSEEALRRGLVAAFPEQAAKLAVKKAADAAAEAAREAAIVARLEIEAKKLERTKAHRDEIEAKKLERTKAHLASIEAAAKAKAERVRESAERNRNQAEMFLKACYDMHPRDFCEEIWNRARQMFAGDPAWKGPA